MFLEGSRSGAFRMSAGRRSVEEGRRLTQLSLRSKTDKWVEAKWTLILIPMRTSCTN